jgi:hypothetical protein
MSWIGPLHIWDRGRGVRRVGLGYVYCSEKRVNEISWDEIALRSPDEATEELATRNFWTSLRFSHFVHCHMQYEAHYRPPFIPSHKKHTKSTVTIKIYTSLPQRENKHHFSPLGQRQCSWVVSYESIWNYKHICMFYILGTVHKHTFRSPQKHSTTVYNSCLCWQM